QLRGSPSFAHAFAEVRAVALRGVDRASPTPVVSSRSGRAEKSVHLRLGAEPRNAVARELVWIALAASGRMTERERDQGVTPRQGAAEGFAVAVPELLAECYATERPQDEAREPHAPREVEPDDGVRRLEDQVAELP